jgi:hypothetical protein
MTRRRKAVLVVLAAVIATSIVLSMAVLWGPHHDCALQFPKILGCALASYESLSGSLIAAGGALLAAWLAWSALTEQIKLEKEKMLNAEIEYLQHRAANISRETSSLKSAYSNAQSLWRLLHEETRDPSPNVSKLIELSRRQAFPATSDGWTSQTIGTRLWESVLHIREMAKQIELTSDMLTADMRLGVLAGREADAAEVVKFFNSIFSQLPAMIAQMETAIADENDRVQLARSHLVRLRG